jgi:penicillin amidase
LYLAMKTQVIALCFALCFLTTFSSFPTASAQRLSSIGQVRDSVTRLAGIRSSVVIRRDVRGIPYIEASNEDDLYFAQGYIVASDRLWQMELLRRAGRGELAEVFGRRVIEEDNRHRTFGFASITEQMVDRMTAPAREAFEAYARGVNAFIGRLDEKSLPLEFRVLKFKPRPWRPADSLIAGKIFAESLTTSWQKDLMQATLADLPEQRRAALLPTTSPLDLIMVGSDSAGKKPSVRSRLVEPIRHESLQVFETLRTISDMTDSVRRSLERVGFYAEDLAASNNWVVSGKRSASGKPLLANDPHLSPSAPSIWYMAHLSAPKLQVAGVTIAGVPGIVIGHNNRIAWGITNLGADVQDLYIEKFSKDNPRQYMTPEGWREAEVRREQIKVRKSPTEVETETVNREVITTRHGPIILQRDGVSYALAWSSLDRTVNELEAYYAINRAGNWEEFRAALSRYNGFPLSYIFADVEGHIGYWAAGRYPIRKAGGGNLPYDGATDAGDWTGYIPFEATPHLYDPPSGIIVTANNRVVGHDYPYYITNEWSDPYRARRIYNLLTAKQKMTIEDFRAIQADTYSFPDATFAAEVVRHGRPLAATSSEWREMVAAFDGWDAMMNAESRVAPLVSLMRDAFHLRILAGVLGADRARRYSWANSGTLIDLIITTLPREWLPKEYDSYETLLQICYKEAREALTKALGADTSKWTWGRLRQLRFLHPLSNVAFVGSQFSVGPVPQNGGPPTVNRGGFVSMRFIADLSNWDNTRMGLPLGQSGDPSSAHWKDQLAEWQTVTPGIFRFSKNAVTEATKENLVRLEPNTK